MEAPFTGLPQPLENDVHVAGCEGFSVVFAARLPMPFGERLQILHVVPPEVVTDGLDE